MCKQSDHILGYSSSTNTVCNLTDLVQKRETKQGTCKNWPSFTRFLKGTVSWYKRMFSNRSRMGIPNIQSSTWAMWFCDITTTPLACAWLADLALWSGMYFVLASEIDFVRILGDVEWPAYFYLQYVAFVSWAYQPWIDTLGSLDRSL